MSDRKTRDQIQYAALPWRIGDSGDREIMLVTSRETHRWVIPKGWPIAGLKPREVAVREAYEEAGLVGTIQGKKPFGRYHYEKQLPTRALLCEVRVFLFKVDHQLDEWPEKAQRECLWTEPERAADLVNEGGLAELLQLPFAPQARKRSRQKLLPLALRKLGPAEGC
jgi:8-oxo-dGTP pyrophosphatase MutT (NUDIX family)